MMQCLAKAKCGFSLIEVLVAASVIGVTTCVTLWALAQSNTNASIARLQTGALTAAQNRIDRQRCLRLWHRPD
jgi:prepilin-type N-terminal cleavage/methylation domain-containing protein